MYAAPASASPAIQIGDPRRVIVMDLARGEEPPQPRQFVNPQILWASDEIAVAEEGLPLGARNLRRGGAAGAR